jgi:hypothetical protein
MFLKMIGGNTVIDCVAPTSSDFSQFLRTYLGIMDGSLLATQLCHGCRTAFRLLSQEGADAFIGHAMCCSEIRGNARQTAHNTIVEGLRRLACDAGIVVTVEPNGCCGNDDGRRPDLKFELSDGRTVLIDVTLVSPYADHCVIAAGTTCGAAANAAADAKRRKYADIVNVARKIEFMPYVVESLGFFHNDALKIGNIIVDEYKERMSNSDSPAAISMQHMFTWRVSHTMIMAAHSAAAKLARSRFYVRSDQQRIAPPRDLGEA